MVTQQHTIASKCSHITSHLVTVCLNPTGLVQFPVTRHTHVMGFDRTMKSPHLFHSQYFSGIKEVNRTCRVSDIFGHVDVLFLELNHKTAADHTKKNVYATHTDNVPAYSDQTQVTPVRSSKHWMPKLRSWCTHISPLVLPALTVMASMNWSLQLLVPTSRARLVFFISLSTVFCQRTFGKERSFRRYIPFSVTYSMPWWCFCIII